MSNRRVWVTGVGIVSALGDAPAAFHETLCAGRTGIAPLSAFPLDGLTCRLAGQVTLQPETHLGTKNLRPLDRTGRLAAAAAALALADAGWHQENGREAGLILGTMFGSVHTISAFDRRGLVAGPTYVKPMDFANSVINAAAGQAAIWHALRGVNATLAGGATAGLQALAYAADLIRAGRADALLAGGAEELCYESFLGFDRAGWLAPGDDTHPVPFHPRRNGFVPAEGAALLMLESQDSAAARGARIMAEIRGHGTRFDLSRGRDEGQAASAVAGAVQLALQEAGLGPDAVDAVSTAANGSIVTDRVEAAGLKQVLGARADSVPVTAVKAAVGEAMGASGALQAVALLESMRSGRLPGIRGLDEYEPGFPLLAASSQTRSAAVTNGLVCAAGHDGTTAALMFGPAGGGG